MGNELFPNVNNLVDTIRKPELISDVQKAEFRR